MKRYSAQVSFSFWAEDKKDAVEQLRELMEDIINDDEELKMMISKEKE